MKEIWVSLKDRPSYQVSNFGKVRTIEREVISNSKKCIHKKRIFKSRILSMLNNGKGYLVLCTQIQNKKKNYYIHRLVADAFIPNPKKLSEVNHKDGNKANNHVSNLEWVTRSTNCLHAYRMGLKLPIKRGKSGAARLVIDTYMGIYYDCIIDAAEAIGINPQRLQRELNHKKSRCIINTNIRYA